MTGDRRREGPAAAATHPGRWFVPPHLIAGLLIGVLFLLLSAPVAARNTTGLPELAAGQRIYDQTGTSLTPAEAADLGDRLRSLEAAGADPVVLVRELDATPEETLEQVEALQRAWARRTGIDPASAVAILINRNPDDPEDARAGIFVGATFDEGNVPEDEQRDIVEEALIPPLRDGDVHASLVAGVDRLTSSIRTGPPEDPFELWAADAGSGWLPWAALGAAAVGLAAAPALFRRRQTTDLPAAEPTTSRPGDLAPALAGALVEGGPPASAVQATLMDLAGRGAVGFEMEREGGTFRQPRLQVRLLDRRPVEGPIEEALWRELEERADGDLVSGDEIRKLAASPEPVRQAIRRRMEVEGWLNPGARTDRVTLGALGTVALVLTAFCLIVAAAGGRWWPMIVGVVALALVGSISLLFLARYSPLSRTGQEAAIPWKAYRAGLKETTAEESAQLDLDTTLPDLIALGLGSSVEDRLEAAGRSGRTIRALTGTEDATAASYVPLWAAFSATTASSSGGAVSGAGASGGGGAAGST